MHNRVTLIGNLTRDPEMKKTKDDLAIVKFGFATNRVAGKDKDGAPKEEVTFIDITVFGKLAELCEKYLAKGRQAFIDGRLQQERWVGEDGANHSRHVVVAENIEFLGSKDKSKNQEEEQ